MEFCFEYYVRSKAMANGRIALGTDITPYLGEEKIFCA